MALKGSIGRNQSTFKPLERTLISLNWNQQAKEDKPHHCGKYNSMKYVSLDDWILLLHVMNIKTYFFFFTNPVNSWTGDFGILPCLISPISVVRSF